MRRFAQAACAAALLAGATVSPASAAPNLVTDFFTTLLGAPQMQQAPVRQASLEPTTAEPSRPASVRIPREIVAYGGAHAPGTVIVNTGERRLYLVMSDGKAIRYPIGVGRDGFQWAGTESISRKQEWPDWRPPEEMLQRRPDLPRFMAGGPENPLGARALYLGHSLYRIHGSNEPDTIGQAVSSGCIRMLNEDVVDLYERVKIGTRVVVVR